MHPNAAPALDMPLPDAALAAGVTRADDRAFEALMRRHNRSLFRAARSILKDDGEAEEAVQDAYLLAYRGMAGFRGESRLSTWLVRIVVNEALRRARRNQRRAEVIRLGELLPDAIEESDHVNPGQQPQDVELRAEVRRLIESKIDQLPDAFRTVFVLRTLEEMSVEETADALGIPAATVRSRFFRAKGLLREALTREIDFNMEEAFGFDGIRCDRIVAGVLGRLPRPD